MHGHELFWTYQVCFNWSNKHLVPGNLSFLVCHKLWMLVALIWNELNRFNCLVCLLDLNRVLRLSLLSLEHPLLRLLLCLRNIQWFFYFFMTTRVLVLSNSLIFI